MENDVDPTFTGVIGSTGTCYNNADAEKLASKEVKPGDCVCKAGFAGSRCEKVITYHYRFDQL